MAPCFDAVESGGDHFVARGLGEVGRRVADLRHGQGVRRDGGLVAPRREDGLGQWYRRRRHRYQAAGNGMADPAAVLELQEAEAAASVHRVGDPPPAGHVGGGVDAGDVQVGRPTAFGLAASAMISPAEARWA